MSRIDQALRKAARRPREEARAEPFALSDYVSESRRGDAAGTPAPNDEKAAPSGAVYGGSVISDTPAWNPEGMLDPAAEITQQIGRLATVIRERHVASPGFKSIAVTSVTESDLKTRAAVALALMLANHGRTILIDAETSPPFVHEMVGMAASPGLSDLPAGSVENLAVVERPPLHLVAAGSGARRGAGPIARAMMRDAVVACASKYDWVVLNAPALSGAADDILGPSLTGACDGVVVVVPRSIPFLGVHRALTALGREALVGTVVVPGR